MGLIYFLICIVIFNEVPIFIDYKKVNYNVGWHTEKYSKVDGFSTGCGSRGGKVERIELYVAKDIIYSHAIQNARDLSDLVEETILGVYKDRMLFAHFRLLLF